MSRPKKYRGARARIAAHARARAQERYDPSLTGKDLALIVAKIHDGQTLDSKIQSNSRSIHRVMYLDRVFQVVYSRRLKQIVTCIPVEALESDLR